MNNKDIYKRKMSQGELQEHLKVSRRARTFKNKKKEDSRLKCRGRVTF